MYCTFKNRDTASPRKLKREVVRDYCVTIPRKMKLMNKINIMGILKVVRLLRNLITMNENS